MSQLLDIIRSALGRVKTNIINARGAGGYAPRIVIDREGEPNEEMRVYAGISSLRHSPFMDNFTLETQEMRAAYRKWGAEPTIKSALIGKVYNVAALGLQVTPDDKRNPLSHEKADYIRHCLTRPLCGFAGVIWNTLIHSCQDGWSVCEPVLADETRGRFRGKPILYDYKAKDTRYIIPLVDEYRNTVGLYNFRGNAGRLFDPNDFIIFTHLPLFQNVTGISDMRAAYRSMQMIPAVIKLRMIFLDKYCGPFLKGTIKDKGLKHKMASELAKARADGFIVLNEGSTVDAVDLATRGTADFQAGLDDLRKEAATAISGAFLHMMTAGDPNARGDSQVQRGTVDIFVWALAEQIAVTFNHQLVPRLIDLAYGSTEDCPKVSLEAVNPDDIKADLGIDEALDRMGVDTSLEELRERARRSPPKADNDSVQKAKQAAQQQQQPGGGFGQPPGGGFLGFSELPDGHQLYLLPTGFNLSPERRTSLPLLDDTDESFDTFAEGMKFTGERKDKAGRRICYQEGKRVPCQKQATPPKPKPPANPADTHKRVTEIAADPSKMTEQELRNLPDMLTQLTVPQLKAVKQTLGVKGGNRKAEHVAKLQAYLTWYNPKPGTGRKPIVPRPQPPTSQPAGKPSFRQRLADIGRRILDSSAFQFFAEGSEDMPELLDLTDSDARLVWTEALIDAILAEDEDTAEALLSLLPDDDQQEFQAFAEGAGFTGTRKDALGRTRCYQNGKQVPCPKEQAGEPTEGKPAQIDYAHRDPTHQLAQAIQADEPGKKLVADFHSQFVQPKQELRQKLEADEDTLTNSYYEMSGILDKVVDLGDPDTPEKKALYDEYNDKLGKIKPVWDELRKSVESQRQASREISAKAKEWLAANVKPENPSNHTYSYDPDLGGVGDKTTKAIDEAFAFLNSITGGSTGNLKIGDSGDSRGAYSKPRGVPTIGIPADAMDALEANTEGPAYIHETAAHELGHHIEETKPGLMKKAHEFLAYRCGSEPFVQLNSISGGGYSAYEVGRKDSFDKVFPGVHAYYVGKRYGQGEAFPTEVISMGIEALTRDPIGFARSDPEYFHWLISVLKG